jgi:hypothetical protein
MNKIYNIGAYGIPSKILTAYTDTQRELRWSKHALQELRNDRYGVIYEAPFLRRFDSNDWTLVEAETQALSIGDITTKLVVRREIDPTRSLVLVIIPDGPYEGFVKTAWINLNTDNHGTLDKTRFDCP